MPDEHGNPTDEERLAMYHACNAEQKFDVGLFARFVGALSTGNILGIAEPFIRAYEKEGCDGLLSDAQKAQLKTNTDKAAGRFGLPTGRMPPL